MYTNWTFPCDNVFSFVCAVWTDRLRVKKPTPYPKPTQPLKVVNNSLSMLSRISQFKQTLTDEFEQASQAKPGIDPIAMIERNKGILNEETPNVDQIINDLDSTNESSGNNKEENSQESENKEDKAGKKPEPVGGSSNETKKDAEAKGAATSDSTAPSASAASKDTKNHTENESSKPSSKKSTQSEKSKAEPPKAEPPKTDEPTKNQQPQNEANVATKLAKLAKFEEKYPLLLKAYKTEKKRGELVKLYESVLSEHTPCTSISQPQELVDYLNSLTSKTAMLQKELTSGKVEFENTQKSLEASKRSAEQSTNEVNHLKQQISKLTQEHNELKSELKTLKEQKNDQQATAKADAELKNRIEILQNQLNSAEQSRDAAQKSQSTLKSQLEEMTARFSELQSEGDVIRDEMVDAERISQQRLNELNALKDSLRHRERDRRQNADSINDRVTSLTTEKEQLEGEVEQLNKRIIRESEHLTTQIKSLRIQLADSEGHERELRKQLSQAHSRSETQLNGTNKHVFAPASSNTPHHQETSSHEAENKSDAANEAALHEARASAASAAKANELLKAVNADNVLRIEKLQKTQRALTADLEQMRHENALLKRRRSSVTSVNPVGAAPTESTAESEKQQAYLKNVILGFAEHRDQRKALLPVLATLLGLSDSEANKFVANL